MVVTVLYVSVPELGKKKKHTTVFTLSGITFFLLMGEIARALLGNKWKYLTDLTAGSAIICLRDKITMSLTIIV